MEFYKDILARLLADYPIEITFAGLNESAGELVEMKCYQTLKEIKAIVEDDSFDDPECFIKIEQIVCALESMGTTAGFRHNFRY